MRWRWFALCSALAVVPALACDDVDRRDPSVLQRHVDGGLGGSSLGGSGGGGASGASGAGAAGASGAGGADAGAGGASGGVAGDGGSGGACASGTRSCGEVCVADGDCCEDSDCGGPGIGACSTDGQCACLGSAFGASCSGRFIGLGVVGLVDTDSEARAVSGDGQVVVGWSGVGTEQPHAVRWIWESGQSQVLGELEAGGTSIALAVSNDGSVVVGDASLDLLDTPSTAGFGWTLATGMDALAVGELSVFTHAEAVTSDGSIVVGWANNDGEGTGAYWEGLNAGLQPVSSPPDSVRLFAVNGSGSLFGGDAALGPVTFNPDSGFQVLNQGPFSQGSVAAISANGVYLVGTMDGGQAVRWFEGVGDPLELGAGLARDVSDDGTVVGESEGAAVIWSAVGQKTTVLALLEAANVNARTGWTLQRARGISNDGRVIVGAGTRSGRQEGWLLRLPAAP